MPSRPFALVAWLGFALALGLHVAFWRGLPLSGASLGGLVLAFMMTAIAALGLVLAVQRAASRSADGGVGAAYFAVVPRVGRWALGLGFVYVAAHLVDWLPVGGGGRVTGDPSAFERAFTAILAWQLAAAGLYHAAAPKGEA